MAKKDPIKVEAKPALLKLVGHEDYKCEHVVAVEGVWDITKRVGMGEGKPDRIDILVGNIFGTKEQVTKFAQEAYGFQQDCWTNAVQVVQAKTKLSGLIDVSKLLGEFGISGKPVPERSEE